MKKMSDEEFSKLIKAAHESRQIEFKSPFSWVDDNSVWLREKVVRCILGMANTPDGGYLIIGIEEDVDKKPVFSGIEEDAVNTFNYDVVKGVVDGYSFTGVNFEINQATYENKKFVALRVEEFDDIPVICKKDSQTEGTLKRGVVYCRSRSGPPKTIPVTETEMHEILQMAVDKQREHLKRRGYEYSQTEVDSELFKKQRESYGE